MPFLIDDEERESTEEMIRRLLRGADETPPSEDALLEEAAATPPLVTPTPTPDEAFEGLATPVPSRSPQPTQPLETRTPDVILGQKGPEARRAAGDFTEGEKVFGEDAGTLADFVAPFTSAVDAFDQGDEAQMKQLANRSIAEDNPTLARYVGRYMALDVRFEALDDEEKQVVAWALDELSYEQGGPFYKEEWTDAEKTRVQTNVTFLREQYARSPLGEGFDDFKSEWNKARTGQIPEPLQHVPFVRDLLAPPSDSPADELKMGLAAAGQVVPLGAALRGIIGVKSLAFIAAANVLPEEGQVKLEEWGLSHEIAEILSTSTSLALLVAAGAGAPTKEARERVSHTILASFIPSEPVMIETVMNDDLPLIDRIMTGTFIPAPFMGFFGAGVRNALTARRQIRHAVEVAEFETSTRVTTANEVFSYRGTPTVENAAAIRSKGFDPNREVYMASSERTARAYGDELIEVRPRGGLVLIQHDTPLYSRIYTTITERVEKARANATKQGKRLSPEELERIERETLIEHGIEGIEVVSGERSIIRVFDPKNVEVKDAARVDVAWINEATRGEEAARPADWAEPDIGLDFSGMSHAKALEAWKASADWLERGATAFLRKRPGFAPLFNWVATGSDGLTHPLTFAMTRFLSDRWAYHMRSSHAAETFVSRMKMVFKNRRSGKGGVAEVQLADGKWYALDAVMSGLHDGRLSASQRTLVDMWIKENETFHAWAREQGYKARAFYPRGGRGFFPNRRMIEAQESMPGGAGGGKAVGRRVTGSREREFELAEEGVAKKGAEYWGWDNMEGVLFDHFFGKYEGVLATKLKRVTDRYSETVENRLNRLYRDAVDGVPQSITRLNRTRRLVETELKEKRNAKARELTSARSELQAARRLLAREEGRVSGRLAKAREQGRMAQPGARVENARARVEAMKGYVETLRQELVGLPKATRTRVLFDPRVQAAVEDVAFAKAKLAQVKEHLIDHGQELLVQKGPPIIQGRIFNWENYKRIMKKLEQKDPSGWERVLIELQAMPRVLWATLDHSVGLIHLGGVALAHPIAWTQVMGASMYRLLRGRYPEWVMNHKFFKESVGHGLLVGTLNEIRQPGFQRSKAVSFIEEKIPVVSPAIKAANILFGATGSQARLMLYSLWRETWFRKGGERGLDRLADHINKMTGVTRSGAAVEAGVLFAPRFLRANLGLMADAFRGKETGRLAREYWARFLLTGSLLTVLFNELQGTAWNLNPLDLGKSLKEREGRPEPFSIPIPTGGQVSVLMAFAPLVRAAAHVADGDFAYPITRTARGKAAPLFNELWSQIEGRTFMGEKVPRPGEEPAEFVKYLAESLLPFAGRGIKEDIETQIELAGGDITAANVLKTLPAIAGEILGGRYRPESISEARFARTQQLLDQAEAGEIKLPREMMALIESEGEQWVTWGDVPGPIRDTFIEQDAELRSLNDLVRNRQIAEETEFAEVVKLTEERNEALLRFSEWAQQGRDDEGRPYTREDYRYDVGKKGQEIRNTIEGVKRQLGYEEDEVPENAPVHIRLLDEYARTVIEPSQKLSGDLDGEKYEQLLNEMADRHAGEKVDGVPIMQILDSLLADRRDAFYRNYRRDMQALRPYFDFLDDTWTPEFIEAADLEFVQPNAPELFGSALEFEKAIVIQLGRQLEQGQGFGVYGQVWFDKTKGETYEEHYGPTPEFKADEARSVAKNVANAIVRDFYVARDEARDWWMVNKRSDLIDPATEWGFFEPDKETLDKIQERR